MSSHLFIWIARWEDFQHYAPERDRAPAWIKTYTKQHDDDDYRRLTGAQRAILHDLRIAFARSNGRLTSEQRALTQRIGLRVTSAQLKSLSHAGFIEICSREVLDQRLEKLYASRARAPAHQKEVEVERETPQTPLNGKPRKTDGSTTHTCSHCGKTHRTKRNLALHIQNVHDGPPVPLDENEIGEYEEWTAKCARDAELVRTLTAPQNPDADIDF